MKKNDKKNGKNNRPFSGGKKTIAFWLVIFLLMLSVFHFMNEPLVSAHKLGFSEFMSAVKNGEVEQVTIQEDVYSGKYKSGAQFETVGPINSEKALATFEENNVAVNYVKMAEVSIWQHLLSWLPLILLFGFFFFSMRQIQVGGGKAMGFGRSKAKLLNESQKRVTFNDVAGVEEAKEELEEIVAFLKDPKKFTRLGGRIPKGVLLMGSPGTGKTLLAKAIAGEARVPFFSISGSDFVEMFVGVGASRVRDLFEQGKKNAPCIIFIDEIDAVGRHRGAGIGGGHDEREQTLNQLLVEMDGFESNEGVIIMAATNRPDVLDPALLRAGRFDRRITVSRPDLKGRFEILKVHTRNKPLDINADLEVLARGTPGFSGADLENVVNEAALIAARYNKNAITIEDLELAKDKVLMGSERKSMIVSEDEKKNTAYHEAGHALVAKMIPGTDPLHKVTIIPRGMALGLTQQLPVDERYTQNKTYCYNTIAILMGGRAAEQLIFSEPTTGAGNDIERATDLAHKMVCEWGMSEKLGPLAFGKKEEQVFLGKEMGHQKNYSDTTAQVIDEEVHSIVRDGYDKAFKILTDNKKQLEDLAIALLEHESLDADQIDRVVKGEKLAADQKPVQRESNPEKKMNKPSKIRNLIPDPGKA